MLRRSSPNATDLALKLGEMADRKEAPDVSVVFALPRPRAVRRACRAACEIGVRELLLVGAARVEKTFLEAKLVQPEKLRASTAEGVMQAAVDTRVPPVRTQPRLHLVPEMLRKGGVRVVLHPGGSPLERVLSECTSTQVTIAIGPEGGWLDHEVQFLQRHGFAFAGLGPRLLTTEVALTVFLTIVHQHTAKLETEHSGSSGTDKEEKRETGGSVVVVWLV